MELHLGKDGATMNIGTGGMDASLGTVANALKGAAVLGTNGLVSLYETASNRKGAGEILRAQYGYGDWKQKLQLFGIATGLVGLNLEESAEFDAKTEMKGARRVVTLAGYHDGMSVEEQLQMGIVLGHEAYRNGIEDENNEAETVAAVKGHTEMGVRMVNDGKYSVLTRSLADDMNAYFDKNADFAEYVAGKYDSSADYWKLRSVLDDDGNVVSYGVGWDDSLDLTIENADGTTTEIKAGQIQNEGLNDISQWFSNNGLAFDDKLRDGFVSLGKVSEATQALMDAINNANSANNFDSVTEGFTKSIGDLLASGLQIGGLGEIPDQSQMYSLMPDSGYRTTLYGWRLVTSELNGIVTGTLFEWGTNDHKAEDIAGGKIVQTPTTASILGMKWNDAKGFEVSIGFDNGYKLESNHLGSASGMNLLEAMLQSGSTEALAAGLQFASVGMTGTAATGPHNHLVGKLDSVGKLNSTIVAPSEIFAAMGIPANYTNLNTGLSGYSEKLSYNDPRLLQDIRNNMPVADRQAYVNAHSELFQPSVEFVNGKSLVKHEFDIVTMSYKTNVIRPPSFIYGIGLQSQPSFRPGP
jgi:hypothetical protein